MQISLKFYIWILAFFYLNKYLKLFEYVLKVFEGT